MHTNRTLRTKPLYPGITKDKIFSQKNIKNPFQKIAGSLAHQTLFVKPYIKPYYEGLIFFQIWGV